MQRRDADVTSAPVSSVRLVRSISGLIGSLSLKFDSPTVFPAKTDLWVEGELSTGSGIVDSEFDLCLRDV